ncbi:sensory box histidine kinase/response regulator [Teredinibacter turnerae T7901]|uniref:histidine kinase n=1 Tax=Teredinibacter turnerae (strain ATCC 39867 / T7901) TaxID=377629 RepID=C5BP44_TERTT|nr:ATP-binding protein [Teredinibacter turnerae]ACR13219.1 sensory box histidine kinase/response regulator [Teredinibacter turnerae T7901]
MLDVIWNPELSDIDINDLGEEMASYQRSMLGCGHGFWEWDLGTNKLRWYGTFWRELGYSELDIQTMTAPEVLLNYIHPDDRALFQQAVTATIREGVALDLCYRLQAKAGYYLWVRVNGQGFRDASGWTHQLAGANYNISQLKQTEQALRASEARYSRIIAGTRDGVWDWSFDNNVISFSDICWEQIGFTAEDVRELNLTTIADWEARMSPVDVKRFKEALRKHILERAPFDIEYQIKAKDGTQRWIRARAEATYNKEGRAVKISGSNMDITELKNTQLAVVQAKVAAEQANQAKSEFLSSMSHELRTPLNAILGYVQLFDYDTNLTPDQCDNLQEVKKAGTHLLHLINEVLDLAKIEAGRMTLSMEPVYPQRLLDEAVRLVSPLAQEQGITIERDALQHQQSAIFADNTRLKQALLNLISNAVKYNTKDGSVNISLTAVGEGRLRIMVTDTGRGIPDALQAQVFEPFNRLHAELGAVEGSGVGLVITKRLVEMMGGTLGFHSEVGVGSRFWMDLPLAKEGVKSVSVQADDAFARTRKLLNLAEPKRILYIEDNPANTRLFEKIIQRFELLSVKTVMEPLLGLYEARTSPPDLIVLDINLPDLDGYQVLEVLKNDFLTRGIPVVALSANAMSQDVDKGLQAGFVDYLTKPVDVNRLVDVLNRHLGGQDC